MLLEIAQWLAREYRVFAVFNYITLRAVLATLTALFVGLLLPLWVFAELADEVHELEAMVLDDALLLWLQQRAGPRLDAFFVF